MPRGSLERIVGKTLAEIASVDGYVFNEFSIFRDYSKEVPDNIFFYNGEIDIFLINNIIRINLLLDEPYFKFKDIILKENNINDITKIIIDYCNIFSKMVV